MNIWANHITNLTDGRYFAAYNAAWISFCFNPESPDFIAPNVAVGIAGWLEGPQMAGSFGRQQTDDDIRNMAESLNLQAVVLNIEHDATTLEDLPVFWEISTKQLDDDFENLLSLVANKAFATCFILHFETQKTTFNDFFETQKAAFEALKQATEQASFYLKMNFEATDLRLIAQELPHLQGIVLQGGEEEAVGIKSFDELDEIMTYFE
ncbi:MAG: hypothetical protein RI894_1633 [Bacteroidota bacterium]|jgi:phosphoribosylanthranilate isomerase